MGARELQPAVGMPCDELMGRCRCRPPQAIRADEGRGALTLEAGRAVCEDGTHLAAAAVHREGEAQERPVRQSPMSKEQATWPSVMPSRPVALVFIQ